MRDKLDNILWTSMLIAFDLNEGWSVIKIDKVNTISNTSKITPPTPHQSDVARKLIYELYIPGKLSERWVLLWGCYWDGYSNWLPWLQHNRTSHLPLVRAQKTAKWKKQLRAKYIEGENSPFLSHPDIFHLAEPFIEVENENGKKRRKIN